MTEVTTSGRPWPAGAATGIGSWPGTDPMAAARVIFGELPDLPHLPELPARGPGADMIGRSAVFLPDLPVQIEPSGWRFTGRSGADARRARDFLARDLDAVQQLGAGHVGAVKVQAAGPITLAASIELANGHRAISDPGAVRDLAESLREGLRAHVADVAGRLPRAQVVLQLDEPSLPAALAGQISTPSGYGTVRALDATVAEGLLRLVLEAVGPGARVVHCCAAGVPVAALVRAGADAVAVDLDRLHRRDLDAVGTAVDGGTSLWLGALAADQDVIATPAAVALRVTRLWDQLGFAPERVAESVVITPSCGLAAASPDGALSALGVLREAGQRLTEHG